MALGTSKQWVEKGLKSYGHTSSDKKSQDLTTKHRDSIIIILKTVTKCHTGNTSSSSGNMRPWWLALSLVTVLLQRSSAYRDSLDARSLRESTTQREQDDGDVQSRGLVYHTCPNDESMIADAVWYEFDVTMWTKFDVQCSNSEWDQIRDLVDFTMLKADMYDNGLNIVSLNQHICYTEPHTSRSLATVDDDSLLLEDAEADTRQLQVLERLSALFFHIFFRGGGKCLICRPDNGDRRLNQNSSSMLRRTKAKSSDKEQSIGFRQRRRMACGGCFNLDFQKYANGTHITGTPYMPVMEYWDSHGVLIRAFGGTSPGHKARIYDTSSTVEPTQNLGSPNEDCDESGPGKGDGGKPTLANGDPNPGANCEFQGNVLIIQQRSSTIASDNVDGGKIVFVFRYRVKLESLGFMDIGENSRATVMVDTLDGKHVHFVNGFGRNSIEDVILNMEKVKRVVISLNGPGAIRYIKYCHDCGEEEQLREQQIQAYYPPDDVRPYENQASVYHFDFLLPVINADVTALLQDAVDVTFSSDPSSCLYDAHPHVQARLITSTPGPANNCDS